jgi:CysZ protein
LFKPISLAISQLDDPAFRGVVLRSAGWALAAFAALHFIAAWLVANVLQWHGILAWAGYLAGGVLVSVLTLWLFLPIATAIGAMYVERIAIAVESRFYPWLQPASGASVLAQSLDGVAVGLRVLVLNIIGLALTILLPGIGFIPGWAIGAYAIGRGLFVAVAMRRVPRPEAERLYRANRGPILLQGAVLALGTYVPVANLLIPVIATAAMVHAFDATISRRCSA